MSKGIVFEWEGFSKKVPALLLEDIEPEVCREVWEALATPWKMWPWHTTSTGDFYSAQARPPRHPVPLGSQATPRMGKTGRPLFLCDLEPGSLCYPGGLQFSFAYGADNTEPLPAKGPVFARVPEAHLAAFYEAGRHVWNAQYRTHKLIIITATREENL
ncbi:hypothetical protein [Devosia sp.]|uniref:hypothetical protein n=1 Tax=Devosia sp. TaxID=1871048 RepID=UPI002F0C4D05